MRKTSASGRAWQGGLLLVLLFLTAGPAAAFQFSLGEVQGSLDTTVSYGLNWRTSEPDKDIVGIANGGKAYSVNGDDGNLNYDEEDYFSKVFKITSDLELKYSNFGLFLRGTAFRDFVNDSGDLERTQLSDEALDMVGEDAELLDAFLWWDFELGGMPGTLKVGDQVLSWGESTFIQNSINSINPVDVNKLRVPGSELKEALTPVGMVSGSLAINEFLSFEAFYQYDWEKTEIDPVGSYWSSSDIAGEGADRVLLGFGQWSDLGTSWQGAVIPTRVTDSRFNMVPRGANVYADDSGQYGLAMHLFTPTLNNTEFGLFFMNYHSRLPVISARTGTAAGAAKTLTAGTAAQTFAAVIAANPTNPSAAVAAGITAGTTAGVTAGLPAALAQTVATGSVNAATAGGAVLASAYATDQYAKTAEYFIEYPEDIQLIGMSFNTQLESSGIALQGEISYRRDVPVQVDDLELLFAALGPISSGLAAFNQLANVRDPSQFSSPYQQYLQGYERLDMSQVQVTATKTFGPTFGADQFILVGEVGLTHVHDMPSKDRLRMESPGTYISGNQTLATAHAPTAAGQYEDSSAFADATSWGYRAVARFDYNNAIGAIALSPRVAWSHDVDGNSPVPGGNFLEHRKAVTVGLEANYQNAWTADLSYTDFFGAGRYNLINDRDFVSFNVKYSF